MLTKAFADMAMSWYAFLFKLGVGWRVVFVVDLVVVG